MTLYAAIFEGVGDILKYQIEAVLYRCKNVKNHLSLLNQANGLVFGQRVLTHKSYTLECISCLIFVVMVTISKETLSHVNNNVWWDFYG